MARLNAETRAIVARLRRAAARPLAQACAMPPAIYASPAFFALEQEAVFARAWYCAGRAESLAAAGDYLACRLGRQPVAVMRQRDGSLKAFSNVCRHRMMTLLEGRGSCRRIVCPYHAWTYDLDGRLLAARHMERSEGFQASRIALPEIRCEVWQGWIYLTLDGDAAPPAARLAALDRIVADYGAADYVEVDRQEHVWQTNWKLLTENFMEGYHLPVAHRRTVGAYFPVEDTRFGEGEADAAFTFQWFAKTQDAPIGTAHPANRRLEGAMRRTSVLGSVYPAHMFVLAPDHLWYLSLQPLAPGEVHIRYGLAFAPEVVAEQAAFEGRLARARAFLDRTNEEDRAVVEGLWRGVQAPLAAGGPLSWLEKGNLDFARYLLACVEG